MKLVTRINLLIVALLAVILIGTLIINLFNARQYLDAQLASHAQDAATSLGLVSSRAVAEQDRIEIELLVNAMFDRGYYSRIRVEQTGGVLFDKSVATDRVPGVPGWFVHLVPLPAPAATAPVMAGWNEVGVIYVESHPGYAYLQLWQTSWRLAGWFLALAVLCGLGAGWMLRRLLLPLGNLRQQADGVADGIYSQLAEIPRVPELRSLVLAMNRMTEQVEQRFIEQSRNVERLRRQAFLDPLTGLGNRRLFDDLLASRLQATEARQQSAGLLRIQVRGLAEVNRRKGPEGGDLYVSECGRIIRESSVKHLQECHVVRLAGAEFAVLAIAPHLRALGTLAEYLIQELAALHALGLAPDPDVVSVGVAVRREGREPQDLVAVADYALRTAQANGANKWHLSESVGDSGRLAMPDLDQWRARIREALDVRNASFVAQPVVRLDDEERRVVIQRELFGRLQLGQELIPAGFVLPIADQIGLAQDLDRMLLTRALEQVGRDDAPGHYTLNLSLGVIQDDPQAHWLVGEVHRLGVPAGRVSFEISQQALARAPEKLRQWAGTLRISGCGLGVDDFGLGIDAIGHLRSLRPDYVKLDGSLITRIASDEDTQFLVETLTQAAHSLNIQVIAEAVETEEQFQALRTIGVDAVQGYLVGRPAPLQL